MKQKIKERKKLKSKRRELKRIKLRQEEKEMWLLQKAARSKGSTIRGKQNG